jgi:hypothetical protein
MGLVFDEGAEVRNPSDIPDYVRNAPHAPPPYVANEGIIGLDDY